MRSNKNQFNIEIFMVMEKLLTLGRFYKGGDHVCLFFNIFLFLGSSKKEHSKKYLFPKD